MAYLDLKNVNKIYPNKVQAVFDFNIEIKKGEFIVIVGPSGCGKSTTLRMIAGLEEISSGTMILDGKVINDKAPVDRDIAMVFQNYALYNQMTSYENVGIGLRVRHEKTSNIHRKVMEASNILSLDEYLNRTPKKLSGGQRQRVALGRTIVRNPKVFLMDEPLSNLDAKLRTNTRKELIKLHRQLKATIVYVTHDQIEAMTMATRMVVMNNGHVQQIGTPFEVYNNPDNIFVGDFIGIPSMNFINGKIKGNKFLFENNQLTIPESKLKIIKDYEGKEVVLGIRPENITDKISFRGNLKNNMVKLKIVHYELLGPHYNVWLELNKNDTIIAICDAKNEMKKNSSMELIFNMENCHFFDKDTEKRIKEG